MIDEMSVDELVDAEFLNSIFDLDDELEREEKIARILIRAQKLKAGTIVGNLINAYKKKRKKMEVVPTKTSYQPIPEAEIEFLGQTYSTGVWIEKSGRIVTIRDTGEVIACYHPIFISKVYKNAQTGEEKVELKYFKRSSWRHIRIDKDVLASASKITCLSKYGIAVTSESAKDLVRFLSDFENLNIDLIDEMTSTSKLGWIEDSFVPYCEGIDFDSETRFKDTFNSITQKGSFETWMNLMKSIRAKKQIELSLYMAASFSSVLLKKLDALPFVVNLYGATGKGKTVAMMLATSVWANPDGNTYIADAKATNVALELRLDFLNHLPLMLDDLSQLENRYDDFSSMIYLLCSGKGRDRSNINLGLNKPTTWKNCIITNMERSITNETMKGGAVNRVIDIGYDSDEQIFESGHDVVELIKDHYGYAGKMFVDVIQSIGDASLKKMQSNLFKELDEINRRLPVDDQKEEKQLMPLSILLLADRLCEQYIYKDGYTLGAEECLRFLKSRKEVDESERAYELICSDVRANLYLYQVKDGKDYGKVAGRYDEDTGVVYIMGTEWLRMTKDYNFNEKVFFAWAKKKGLLLYDAGKCKKRIRIGTTRVYVIALKTSFVDDDGFVEIDGPMPFH